MAKTKKNRKTVDNIVHQEDSRSKVTQELEELDSLERDSISQVLPDQKAVFKADSIKSRAGKRGAHNLNLDGYLINCQWDFDYIGGRFAEEKYALMRESKDGKYVAVFKAKKKFEKTGKFNIACRVQDNLGGEAIKVKEIEIK